MRVPAPTPRLSPLDRGHPGGGKRHWFRTGARARYGRDRPRHDPGRCVEGLDCCPAQHPTAPPAADAPPVVSSACVWHRPAPLERCAPNRQTAGARPGCLLSTRCHRPPAHACSLLRPRPTARLGDRPITLPGRVGTAGGADAALGPPCPATRPGGRSADGSRGVEPALVVCDPVAAVLSGHAGACYLDRRADRSGGGSQCRAWCQVQDLEPIWDILSQKEIGWGAAALRPYLYQVSSAVS